MHGKPANKNQALKKIPIQAVAHFDAIPLLQDVATEGGAAEPSAQEIFYETAGDQVAAKNKDDWAQINVSRRGVMRDFWESDPLWELKLQRKIMQH